MANQRGKVILYKYDFDEGEYSINFGFNMSDNPNLHTKAFRRFKNQCVGHPNMTIFKDKQIRDERYEKGKQMLINAGYEVIESK